MTHKIFGRLILVREKEGEAHRIYDNAVSNLAYGNLSTEMRDGYVKSTYRATALHREAIEIMRELVAELNALMGTGYHLD